MLPRSNPGSSSAPTPCQARSRNLQHKPLAACLDVFSKRENRRGVLARGKRALQPSNCRRLRSHAFGNLRLSQARLLSCFQENIEECGLFPLDPIHFGAHAWPSKELLDDLIMGSHV